MIVMADFFNGNVGLDYADPISIYTREMLRLIEKDKTINPVKAMRLQKTLFGGVLSEMSKRKEKRVIRECTFLYTVIAKRNLNKKEEV